MTHDLDLSKLDNPYIQVVWEDFAENFTQEKIKSVRQYFQKKYGTTNVNVITKARLGDEIDQTIDVSVKIKTLSEFVIRTSAPETVGITASKSLKIFPPR